MPRRIIFLLLVLASAASAAAAEQLNFDAWRALPVQDGGRYKPLDSLARETAQLLVGRSSLTDPDTGRKLSGLELYLTMLLDWKGWDAPGGAAASYFNPHEVDRWDRSAILHIDSLEFRDALGLPKDRRFASATELLAAQLHDPATGHKALFPEWFDTLTSALRDGKRKEKSLTDFEKQGLEVGNRLMVFQEMRMGRRLALLPVPGGHERPWVVLGDLLGGASNAAVDATHAAQLKAEFAKLRAAYLAGNAADFRAASTDFVADVVAVGQLSGSYPRMKTINLEVAYNIYAPFRWAWILAMLAGLLGLLSLGSGWRWLYRIGLGCSVLSLAAMATAFALRITISGRAPVTNMYESMVYVAAGATVFGLILEMIYRRQFVLVAASAVGVLALVLADMAPAMFDSTLQPLQPVLRSNYWLVIHVMTITLSYAAFALAWMIGNIALGYYLVGSRDRVTVAGLNLFAYRALQVGVVLLAAGTVLGGWWAAQSWGRFWGWDPKEVFALVALLAYLGVLHARFVGWVGDLGLAACSVLGFALVVMAWYGVNFVLGAGLHSYGFGGGGKWYVFSVVAAEVVYVIIAATRGAETAAQHQRDRLVDENSPQPQLDQPANALA